MHRCASLKGQGDILRPDYVRPVVWSNYERLFEVFPRVFPRHVPLNWDFAACQRGLLNFFFTAQHLDLTQETKWFIIKHVRFYNIKASFELDESKYLPQGFCVFFNCDGDILLHKGALCSFIDCLFSLFRPRKIKLSVLINWQIKLTLKDDTVSYLFYFVYIWRTLPPLQTVFWGPYFPLRTACSFSCV